MKQKSVILYAEDDPDDRDLLREVLFDKSDGHELVEAANGREAMLFLRSTRAIQNPPCLILLDLNMPILNGKETLAIIKSEHDTETIPVIVFTTSSSRADEEFCRRFGVEMITKPETPEDLSKAADRILSYCT